MLKLEVSSSHGGLFAHINACDLKCVIMSKDQGIFYPQHSTDVKFKDREPGEWEKPTPRGQTPARLSPLPGAGTQVGSWFWLPPNAVRVSALSLSPSCHSLLWFDIVSKGVPQETPISTSHLVPALLKKGDRLSEFTTCKANAHFSVRKKGPAYSWFIYGGPRMGPTLSCSSFHTPSSFLPSLRSPKVILTLIQSLILRGRSS